MKLVSKVICASMMLAGSVQIAVASDTTWDFDNSSNMTYSSYSYGNSLTVTNGDDSVNVTAWADSGLTAGSRGYTMNGKVEQGAVWNYEGYGLLNYSTLSQYNNRSSTYDTHAIDNLYDTDMMLFSFEDSVSLTSLNIGWVTGSPDISIAGFSSLPTLTGNTWANVATSAIFTGTFENVGTGVLDLSSVATEAKYWLIGAYNRVFGGDCWSDGNDGFKILALTTHTQDTPPDAVSAPATGGLMAMLFGLMLYRRRMK